MRRRPTLSVGTLLITLFTAAGCNGDKSASEEQPPTDLSPSPAASRSAVMPRTYSTVIELRDAAIAVGYACPRWQQDNVVQFAAESGSCTDDDVFATYATEAQRGEAVSTAKEANQMLKENNIAATPSVFGSNWSISTSRASELAKKLGGTVVR